ncbi:hypothetical protein NPIL_296111, partial [Nephila pilipes]
RPKSFIKSTTTRDRKPPKFEMAAAVRERRASQVRKVLQTYHQHEIKSSRSLGEAQPFENHDPRKVLRSLPQPEIESRRS